jgi:hypothetical protein
VTSSWIPVVPGGQVSGEKQRGIDAREKTMSSAP